MEAIMGSITIHEIDPVLDPRLSSVAKERGKSKNLLVKELLASSLGLALNMSCLGSLEAFPTGNVVL
jgi:hypothetical protein